MGPNYSAVGGQTLNPTDAKYLLEASSGSGAAVAANYSSGSGQKLRSIISPSWQHSLIGLKPTTGLLSRTGIVPNLK
jgi:amidase